MHHVSGACTALCRPAPSLLSHAPRFESPPSSPVPMPLSHTRVPKTLTFLKFKTTNECSKCICCRHACCLVAPLASTPVLTSRLTFDPATSSTLPLSLPVRWITSDPSGPPACKLKVQNDDVRIAYPKARNLKSAFI